MTGVLIKERSLGTSTTGIRPYEDEDRDWGDAPTSQRVPRVASQAPETGRSLEQVLPHCPRRNKSYLHLDFGLLAPEWK